jgi:hypothetical protein
MRLWPILIGVGLIVTLSGCNKVYERPQTDPGTGKYSSVEFGQHDLKKYEPYAGIDSINFVYLRSYSNVKPDEFAEYLKEGLQQMGFKRVYSKEELAQHLIATGMAESVGNLNDLLGLNRLSQLAGPYLVLDAGVQHVGGAWFQSVVVVTDPAKPETILKASRRTINWMNFDAEISGPILNLIKRWRDDSSKLPAPARQPNEAPEAKT